MTRHRSNKNYDYVRALDELGWMIVPKPEFNDGRKWPMPPKAAYACADIEVGKHGEHFARALDISGWMIVVKPEFDDGGERKWPLDPHYGYVPAWADGFPG